MLGHLQSNQPSILDGSIIDPYLLHQITAVYTATHKYFIAKLM